MEIFGKTLERHGTQFGRLRQEGNADGIVLSTDYTDFTD